MSPQAAAGPAQRSRTSATSALARRASDISDG
jgi:hypothetical protein